MAAGGAHDDPVHMAANTPTGDRKAELAAVALPGGEIEPGGAQPLDGEILERVANGEDAQGPARELLTLVLWCLGKLELKRALARLPQAGGAEIVTPRGRGAFAFKRGIHWPC
ncbi:hypothetical protein ACFOHS_19160 [Jhaorihella thermophila]